MRIPISVVAVLLLTTPALASDGVLEISQSCATQGGCFAGDTAGFPVTITQSGSYHLTSNLSVPLNVTAIQIDSINVTLDLEGFIVSGPNVCTGYATTGCTVTAGNSGISSGQYLVVVRNGSVTGMGGDCIHLDGPSSTVERVRILSCGGTGVLLSGTGRVTESFSGGNYGNGISLGDGGSAEGNESRANRLSGISTFGTRLSSGIFGNRVFDNGLGGISVTPGPGTLVGRNVVSANASSSITGGAISTGDNLCNGAKC